MHKRLTVLVAVAMIHVEEEVEVVFIVDLVEKTKKRLPTTEWRSAA